MPFRDLSEQGVAAVADRYVMHRSEVPAAFKKVITQGFPDLPISTEERRTFLRQYLLWLAEQPSNRFDVRKIDRVLHQPGLVENLPSKYVFVTPGNVVSTHYVGQVLIVDPLDF